MGGCVSWKIQMLYASLLFNHQPSQQLCILNRGKVHLTTPACGEQAAFSIDIIYHAVRHIYDTESQSKLAEWEFTGA